MTQAAERRPVRPSTWCPVCGWGQQGPCERCRDPGERVAHRVFCTSPYHGRSRVCVACGQDSSAPQVPQVAVAVQRPAPAAAPAATAPDPTELVILDTETTGLSPVKDRVVQLAAAVVRLPACEVTDLRSMLCSPGIDPITGRPVEIPWYVSKVHGIYLRDVVGKPTFEAVLPRFLAWCVGRPLAAFNAPFDLGFLRNGCSRAEIPLPLQPPLEVFDLLRVARIALTDARSHKLPELARSLGIDAGRSHRADSDVRATAGVLRVALYRAAPRGLRALHGRTETL